MLEILQPTMKLNQRDSVVVALTPIPKATQLTIDQQTSQHWKISRKVIRLH